MGLNLIKHTTQANIEDTTNFPYSEGQKFFTSDTKIFYEDIGGKRQGSSNVKYYDENIQGPWSPSDNIIKLALTFVIIKRSGDTYDTIFFNEDGTPVTISSGGSTPEFSLSMLENDNWKINFGTDFAIQEKVSSVWHNKIKIYKNIEPAGTTTPARKIEIGEDEDDVTLIHHLDFGGW